MTLTYAQTDKATDHLLDFIAGGVPDNPSGESAGNYNAVYGDINAKDPLSKKTFAEIYDMQSDMLAENGISTATGRYQGLKATLQEYQAKVGLPDSTLFTEAVQDDFGLRKMMDRGYSSWWNEAIDDEEFMYRLSCEWASLPDPRNGGASHYDGDSAGNHASTSLECFQSALDEARAYINSDGLAAPDEDELEPRIDAHQGVIAIQSVLLATGDLDSIADIDGIWGPKSDAALADLTERASDERPVL